MMKYFQVLIFKNYIVNQQHLKVVNKIVIIQLIHKSMEFHAKAQPIIVMMKEDV